MQRRIPEKRFYNAAIMDGCARATANTRRQGRETSASAATKNSTMLANSQCSVDMKPVGVTLSGTNLTLSPAIALTRLEAVQLRRIRSNQLKSAL